MANSQFIWVNKTITSTSLSNSYSDANVRYHINRHVQTNTKRHKVPSIAKQGPALAEPASSSIAHYIRLSQPDAQPPAPSGSTKDSQESEQICRESQLFDEKPACLQLTTLSFGSRRSIDPFESLPMIVDPKAFSLMQSYLDHSSSCPMAWDSGPYRSQSVSILAEEDHILATHLSNPLRYYSNLCFLTAAMDHLGIDKFSSLLGPAYSSKALVELQKHIEFGFVEDEELIYGISRIFLAAVLQGDEWGARIHLRAAKYLVDRAGGMDAYIPSSVKYLRYGDLHLAVQTLSAPVFDLAPDPGPYSGRKFENDTILEDLGSQLLQDAHVFFAASLYDALKCFVECAILLASMYTIPREDTSNLEWMACRCGSMISDLLGTRLFGHDIVPQRQVQESFRVTMVLWFQILILLMNNILGPVSIRNNILTVNSTISQPASQPWEHCIYKGLQEWNAIVRLSRTQKQRELSDSFLVLVDIIESMEVEATIRLGPLMRRILSLRRAYCLVDP